MTRFAVVETRRDFDGIKNGDFKRVLLGVTQFRAALLEAGMPESTEDK